MNRNLIAIILGLFILGILPSAQAQVSPVKLKVTRSSKSDTKETYRSSDGRYSSGEKTKTIYYKIELTNISNGAAKDFTIKWAVLVKSDRYMYTENGVRKGDTRVIQGEKNVTLDFAKSTSMETDVIELSGWESIDAGRRSTDFNAKVMGYSVEVFCNDQRVAADIQPADTKAKIDQINGGSEQKRHSF